ncbi:NADase-type glycan-binding domain-containing protein [Agromyces sp. NPDC058110]|uniref:NADase-type glycan-binding domain-containing protein n=1 Tax=Agromyces sp. NPDC058110 TaxID=3346345 RepID=UPI0036DF7837
MRRAVLWTAGAVASAIIGVLIGWKLEPLLPADATCDNPVGLSPVESRVEIGLDLGEYPADPVTGTDFVAANLVDGDPTTAWVEARDDRGEGGELRFTFDADDDGAFDDTITPTLVCVRNGFVKRPDLFRANARLSTVDVTTGGQTHRTTLPVKGADRMLLMDPLGLSRTPTAAVTLVIVATNAGETASDANDLAISDVVFYTSGG